MHVTFTEILKVKSIIAKLRFEKNFGTPQALKLVQE